MSSFGFGFNASNLPNVSFGVNGLGAILGLATGAFVYRIAPRKTTRERVIGFVASFALGISTTALCYAKCTPGLSVKNAYLLTYSKMSLPVVTAIALFTVCVAYANSNSGG